MAKIIDPSDLTQVTHVDYNVIEKTIELKTGGTFTTDGVTLQCVYSFSKERWKVDTTLIKYPFPFVAITGEQFELVDGWNWRSGATINYIRDGGWALKSTGGTTLEEYMNLTTLGTFDATGDTAYYQQQTNGPGTSTIYPGAVNQAIKIFGGTYNGNVNYRSFFKIYLRVQGKIYSFYDLIASQNLSTLTYKKYALPLSNSLDLKVTNADNIISGSTPYNGMSITYYNTGQSRTIGGVPYNFSIIVNGSGGTAEQIYEFVAYQLRKQADIDAGSGVVSGYTAEELMAFVGENLITKVTSGGTRGVYIDNFLSNDTNRLTFYDDLGQPRNFPYVASGTLLFNDNLVADVASTYWVFFTTGYDTSGATMINDNDGNPISGLTNGQASISFTFDYNNNNQGGRTPNTPAPYTAVAIGLSTGQYVKSTGTILKSTSNAINFVAALERNYSNP